MYKDKDKSIEKAKQQQQQQQQNIGGLGSLGEFSLKGMKMNVKKKR